MRDGKEDADLPKGCFLKGYRFAAGILVRASGNSIE
jgi:hypothetical protein